MNPETPVPRSSRTLCQHVTFVPLDISESVCRAVVERQRAGGGLPHAGRGHRGGWARITEVSDEGQVPELKIVAKGDKAVLLVDGEELVGAKQNRVLNLTILVPAPSTTTIPVSCVESGRWAPRSRPLRRRRGRSLPRAVPRGCDR